MINPHRIVAAGAALSMMALTYAQARSYVVHVKSTDYRRATKRVENSGVRLVKRTSKSPCIEGRSWGYNRNMIWVSRGCEGDFRVTPPRRNGRGRW